MSAFELSSALPKMSSAGVGCDAMAREPSLACATTTGRTRTATAAAPSASLFALDRLLIGSPQGLSTRHHSPRIDSRYRSFLHPWRSYGRTHARAGHAVPSVGARECHRRRILNLRPASTVERTQRSDLFPGARIVVDPPPFRHGPPAPQPFSL